MKALLAVLVIVFAMGAGYVVAEGLKGIAENLTATEQPAYPRMEKATITRVVDGDTVELRNGKHARLIGIDTPEEGEPCYDEASSYMTSMVMNPSQPISLYTSPGNNLTDRYGRLLLYVKVGEVDVGLAQIKAGYAVARYDSVDGYPRHDRQDQYRRADARWPDARCNG